MLRTELVDLVNGGTAWAFVGSGVSAAAGYPTWSHLVEETLILTPEAERERIRSDARFDKAFREKRYEMCFSVIEKYTDRDHLERVVVEQLAVEREPGAIASLLSDWPFAGYVTSNYDMALESILKQRPKSSWVSVGNTDSEIRKVSGEAKEVVWHVHGAIGLDKNKSQLVLTEEDYDNLYLEGSRLQRQLLALLTQRRVVFIGFGFGDPELQRILKVVARYTSPTQPIFAFLSGTRSPDEEASRLELLQLYNVDVIPYEVVDGSHGALTDLINNIYGPFVLRRSLRFGRPSRTCPSYDPETTGLLVYNELALRGGAPVAQDALGTLVRARVLALLRHGGPATIDELTQDLLERTRCLREASPAIDAARVDRDAAANSLSTAIAELEDLRLVEGLNGLLGPAVQLTPEGERLTQEQAAAAQLMTQQFAASLESRAKSAEPLLEREARCRIASVAQAFLQDCATRRALGVAMAWYSPEVDFRSYHIVGLLQGLSGYAEELTDADEGKVLVDIIKSILAHPSEAEAKYMGSLMQARFGLCLMGFDPETVAARTRELSRTLFLLDSTTLIPAMGRGSVGHGAAKQLLAQIERVGAAAATTDLLAVEVAEHARWALKELGQSRALTTVRALAAATGRAGAGDNVFIEGCIAEAEAGRSLHFDWYLDSVCDASAGHEARDEVFQDAIRHNGIACLAFADWEGFTEDLWVSRDDLEQQIADRRVASGTYTHRRQVQAEAEALIAVQQLRSAAFKVGGRTFADAYFLSHSRVIDDVSRPARPITMRPQAAQQWLSTLTACDPTELAFIVNGILWELSERGMSIVDLGRITTVFSPLIDASKSQLEEEVAKHRALVAERYGEHAPSAFAEVQPLDAPFVAETYFAAKSRALEATVSERDRMLEKARQEAALTQKEREELQELRAKSKLKKSETKRKRHKLASRATKRTKKRKR
jgi:hypothetical protein